jgi:hypothetical protein
MEIGSGLQQNVQYQDGVETVWGGDVAAWIPGPATTPFDSEDQATQQLYLQEPEESYICVSNSTLRRRRRQRAAARTASMVFDEEDQDGKSSTMQSRELLEQIRVGGEASRCAVARFQRLAFSSQETCRVAQLALEEASPNEAAVLLKGLRGHVRDAIKSMFCNYVLQRAIELLPTESTIFITQELAGVGSDVARHRFGCRILCRLLEHGSLEESSKCVLLEEVLADTGALACHAFGNFVIRHCLEFGLPWHRHLIAAGLCTNVVETAKDQNGSHVVESAVEFCAMADTQIFADMLLSDPDQLSSLATDNYGRHVVKALLRTAGVWQEPIAVILRRSLQPLRKSKQGTPVLQALEAFEGKQPNV